MVYPHTLCYSGCCFECESCANKPETPKLCSNCLNKFRNCQSSIKEANKKLNCILKENSGSIVKNGKLIAFLYILMRDHLPFGTVEKLIRDEEIGGIINGDNNSYSISYSNGWLAQYAENLANRLK